MNFSPPAAKRMEDSIFMLNAKGKYREAIAVGRYFLEDNPFKPARTGRGAFFLYHTKQKEILRSFIGRRSPG